MENDETTNDHKEVNSLLNVHTLLQAPDHCIQEPYKSDCTLFMSRVHFVQGLRVPFFIFMVISSAFSFLTSTRLYSTRYTTPSILVRNKHNFALQSQASDDYMKKWEDMYFSKGSSYNDGFSYSSAIKSEIRVISFDLDNTIWKTSNVISSANDALACYFESKGIQAPIRVEHIMGDLFKANKIKYCPSVTQDANGDTSLDHLKAPTLLTDLRIDAIKEVLLNQTSRGYSNDETYDIESVAKEIFEVWAHARHAAIPQNYASSVIECLKELRQLKTRRGSPVVIGAITDGNSDPRRVKELEEFFDFVISADSVGVSKPDRRIYENAIRHVATHDNYRHVFGTFSLNDATDLTEIIGPWWVHIGDDFMKDIVAAKALNMRSLWCRELINIKQSSTNKESSRNTQRTVQDLVKDVAQNRVLQMTIGTEDFLVDSITNEFADAITDRFTDVVDIIKNWHREGLSER